jgi:hypothetical protein
MLKQLYRHVEHGHVHKIFLFRFFLYFQIYQNAFQLKRAYTPESKKKTSHKLTCYTRKQ